MQSFHAELMHSQLIHLPFCIGLFKPGSSCICMDAQRLEHVEWHIPAPIFLQVTPEAQFCSHLVHDSESPCACGCDHQLQCSSHLNAHAISLDALPFNLNLKNWEDADIMSEKLCRRLSSQKLCSSLPLVQDIYFSRPPGLLQLTCQLPVALMQSFLH